MLGFEKNKKKLTNFTGYLFCLQIQTVKRENEMYLSEQWLDIW